MMKKWAADFAGVLNDPLPPSKVNPSVSGLYGPFPAWLPRTV